MTHKIAKSLLPTEEHINSFQRLCNSQIEEMRKHDAHMANVEKDPENYHPYPPPVAHPDIMNSIIRSGKDYNIAFEIFDDETLEEKKQKLINKLNQKCNEASEKILPSRKRNLAAVEQGQILKIEENSRTTEQNEKLKSLQSKSEALARIFAYQAKMEATIDDLDEKNAEDWKPEAFPEV